MVYTQLHSENLSLSKFTHGRTCAYPSRQDVYRHISTPEERIGPIKREERMKRKALLFIVIFGILSSSISGEVIVREIQMKIPTYSTGPDDPSPPLWNLRVYPYPMQTSITREKIVKTHRVIELENDYIKLLILPELGGRILAALDKTNDNFDFIYHNHVIKPGLVALRGAWLSGGIEWNFPTLGHTVNTFSPVNTRIIKNADGSVTCVVGTEEWVRRMKWEVFITLFPGRSYFKTRIRLFNRTLTHDNGYFWVNAATHAWPDTRVIFPPAEYTYAGGRRNPRPWPIYEGRDVSWYKNTPYAHDYFCGIPGDFNGAYNYEKDNGTAHYASRFESPGKKFWTWGTAPSGAIWEDLLTDEDGQYIEIQAGRLPTQGDTWIFEPHLLEEWDEWWYPLKRMHGFVKANPDAAVNLESEEESVFIAVNSTRKFLDAEIRLFREKTLVFSEKLDISPERFYKKRLPSKNTNGIYRLEFLDKNGLIVIDYSTEKPESPPPELQPDFPDVESQSAETAFLKGYYSIKHWNIESAMNSFKEALELDPGLVPAMRWLGILYFKSGRTEEALVLFNKVLKRDEDDYTARYYRALSKKRLGIVSRLKDDLYTVSRRAAYRHLAPYVLAALELGDENYLDARMLLEKAIRNNPDDIKARVMLAAVERHLGNEKEAGILIEEALDEDPISPLALVEKMWLTGESDLGVLRAEPEYYLEVAADYMEMNLFDDALRTLAFYGEKGEAREYPIIDYYLGYLNDKLGHKDAAQKYFKKASVGHPDYIFPFRIETESVLRLALKYNRSDWKAYYYLGNLLSAKLRLEEGLKSFERAARFSPEFPVLYRNLGEFYWKKRKDYERAEKMFEKAVSCSSDDFRLYVSLDELYAINRKHAERDKLYREAPSNVKENFNYVLKRAQYLVDTDQPTRALEILRTHTFLPWEGWTRAREVYLFALLKRAHSYMGNAEYKKALKDYFAAMEYPENLGTGKPSHPVFIRENYLIGLCYEKLGKNDMAGRHFREAEREKTGITSMNRYYKALALRKLGKTKEADGLLAEMKMRIEDLIQHGRKIPSQYYLWAAMACHALGNDNQAKEYLINAIELDPSDRWVAFFAYESELLR
jgi:tetratricopeptide (TPR) repeat protein